jgi:hypothetical protein
MLLIACSLVDEARYRAHGRTVGACDIESEEHDFGAVAGQLLKIGDVLGD